MSGSVNDQNRMKENTTLFLTDNARADRLFPYTLNMSLIVYLRGILNAQQMTASGSILYAGLNQA